MPGPIRKPAICLIAAISALCAAVPAHAADTFAPTGSLVKARGNAVAVPLPGGRVLVYGGTTTLESSSGVVNSAEIYDPASGRFTELPAVPSRAFAAAAPMQDGRVLIAGGKDAGHVAVATAEIYDPQTNSSIPVGAMGTPRFDAVAAPLSDGRILVAGGITGSFDPIVASAEIFDPGTNTFSAAGVGPMQAPRAGAAASRLPDGRVLVAGGRTVPSLPISSAEAFNPATGTFSSVGSMGVARSGATGALLGDGRVLVAGGLQTSAVALSSAETFNPQTNSFSSTGIGSMGTERFDAVSAPLANGQVLIAGGTLGFGSVPAARTSAEVFPKTPFKVKVKGNSLRVATPAAAKMSVLPRPGGRSQRPQLKKSKGSKGGAGTVKAGLKLNGPAKRALRRKGRVKLKAKVALTTIGVLPSCSFPGTPCQQDTATYTRTMVLTLKRNPKK